MFRNSPARGERKLGELFAIHRESVVPGASPSTVFEHYSIPAWDECGGPALEDGRSIGSNKILLTKPTVLVSKLNPRKPRVALVAAPSGRRVCASTEFIPYVPRSKAVDISYYKWFFGSDTFQRHLQQVATGSTNSHVRANPIETLQWSIPLPTLAEQHRIAEILDTADDTIRRTEQLVAKFQQMKQGLVADLLQGSLVPGRANRRVDRNAFSRQLWPGVEMPTDWEYQPLASVVADVVTGAPIRTEEFVAWGVPVVAKGDVTASKSIQVAHATQFVTPTTSRKYRVSLVDHRYVIVSLRDLVSSAPTLGLASIVNAQSDFLLAQGACALRFREERVLPEFFVELTRSPFFRRYMRRIAVGSTQVHARTSEYLAMFIPVPPQSEQMKFVQIVESIDRSIHLERCLAAALTMIRSGLMGDLLEGRVKVIQGAVA